MGYLDCFAAFVARRVRARSAATAPAPRAACPTFDDAARMVRLTEAVLGSAADRTWKEVS